VLSEGIVIPLKGDINNVANYRGITLLSCLSMLSKELVLTVISIILYLMHNLVLDKEVLLPRLRLLFCHLFSII